MSSVAVESGLPRFTQRFGSCEASGWKSQFAHPRGLAGRMAGRLMALKNRPLFDLVLDELRDDPWSCALEVGFAHGRLVQMLARARPGARVLGVDPSGVMVEQARRRNARAVAEGRVVLAEAGVSHLPFTSGEVDVVVAVNSVQFWPDPRRDLVELRRVMGDGASLVLPLRRKHPTRTRLVAPGFTAIEIEELQGLLFDTGFRDIRLRNRRAGQRDATILRATR